MKIFQKTRLIKTFVAFSVMVVLLSTQSTSAAILQSRSLLLGSSGAGSTTTHKFSFTIPASANLGSIKFTYCTTASGTCTAPTDLNVDGVTLSGQTGATGFSVNGTETTANVIGITRTAANASGAVTYTFSNAVNPSTTNQTFHVRIQTYTDNAFSSTQDNGTVAASTANIIDVTAVVDETLSFCVYTGANCAAGGSSVNLGTLSTSSASTGTSKMDASTNATGGYSITYAGNTLTSGSNTIAAIGGTAAASSPGSEQFGINASVAGSGSGTVASPYNTANYAFVGDNTAQQVASVSAASLSNTYTVNYLANISAVTKAGTYNTSVIYVATATF